MEIIYTGTEECILNIMNNLPSKDKAKAIRTFKNSIVIPTKIGAKQVFIGDIIKINGEDVTIKYKEW